MKIYLAGPDVFRPDACAHGDRLKALCARYGFEGLYPLDTPAAQGSTDGLATARAILRANVALIDDADFVMANLNPFRGAEPDSGTAFEVGFAAARGKPVWAYADATESLVQRLGPVDDDGMLVEDFGLALNLMLACSVTLVGGGPEECLRAMARHRDDPASTLETP
jgi:nucleoside 2-deoxyribosyltransferase